MLRRIGRKQLKMSFDQVILTQSRDFFMVDSYQDYAKYINKYRDTMDPDDVAYMKKIEAAGKYDDPHYGELLMKLYHRCICRIPEWPDAVKRTFDHLNEQVYVTL